MDDTEFANRALACLPEILPPEGLNGGLLAAFDASQARPSLWTRISELVWPGAPVWAPASAFAAALAVGVMLGAVLPAMGNDGMTRFSLDQPASFSLLTPGVEEDL